MKNYTKMIKQRISQFLNSASAAVLRSYELYLLSDLPEKIDDESKRPEEFKKFHDAGKSAASHLESLLKLARATDDPEEKQREDEEHNQRTLHQTMQNAKDELDGR